MPYLFFLLAIFSFGLFSEKMYQRKDPLISSVHTKVKGVAEVSIGNKTRVLDIADYTLPSQGNSFFVITNFLTTEGQTQGICPEYPTNKTCCSSDQDCQKGKIDPLSKGVQTGKCREYNLTRDNPKIRSLPDTCKHRKTCEVSAWCPIEAKRETPRPALLASAENFTVLIKNSIHFPRHNYSTYAKYYKEEGIEKRTLIKAFAIRFDILVFGTGGKFDIIQLIMYIGSSLSYFGVVSNFIFYTSETVSVREQF
ncbi:P2X purinoceptor 7 [Monodelphis domestica]|uniref:P2X purinoceptor 7 n=1 Tax=Monodelphis domestica TaxID=13616 RepID=UPI0024E24D2F|nr:P2X purinoceptor 7 [Monodelphis domestica]